MKKVLIVAGGLQIGGAERVAANISKYAPAGKYEFHYIVFEGTGNAYGGDVENAGGKIFTLPPPSESYIGYIRRLVRLMREHKYVAIHSHTMFNSGINLAVAKLCGVPCRIAHSHTTRTETKVSPVQKIYEFVMKLLILLTATHYFACGVEAGKWLFGARAFEKKGIVIKNGIDTDAFSYSEENRKKIRSLYGIENAFVIGHTGTLLPLKNQKFLIELMPEILKIRENAVLMLMGADENGDQFNKLTRLAGDCGVSDRVIFCGGIMNVNEHLSAADVFALPSLREGTPLALIEAQTNGLPCIVSDAVPHDAFLTDLVKSLSLDDKKTWINSLCGVERAAPEKYAERINACGFGTARAYEPIYHAYAGEKVGAKACISMSFDDGRGDNAAILHEILLPNRIPATFNITTGYVDGSCPAELRPTDKQPMSVQELRKLNDEALVELALHGDRHLNTAEDILEGREKLTEWLQTGNEHSFGFASPGCGLSICAFESEEYDRIRNALTYMRGGYRVSSFKGVRTLCRKTARIVHWPLLFRIAYGDTEMRFRDGKIVYSVTVLRDTTAREICALIEHCIKNGASLTLMLHSVTDDISEEDNWSWSREKFEKLCEYLCDKREEESLDICTTMDLFKRLE